MKPDNAFYRISKWILIFNFFISVLVTFFKNYFLSKEALELYSAIIYLLIGLHILIFSKFWTNDYICSMENYFDKNSGFPKFMLNGLSDQKTYVVFFYFLGIFMILFSLLSLF